MKTTICNVLSSYGVHSPLSSTGRCVSCNWVRIGTKYYKLILAFNQRGNCISNYKQIIHAHKVCNLLFMYFSFKSKWIVVQMLWELFVRRGLVGNEACIPRNITAIKENHIKKYFITSSTALHMIQTHKRTFQQQ